MRRGFVALLALVACGRTRTISDATPASSATAVSVERVADAAPLAIEAPRGCTLEGAVTSIDDGGGKGDEYGATHLENLRVLAEAKTVIVTWERQANYRIGDSWRAPVVAEREGDEPFRIQELPVRAYACATYGHISPLSAAEHVVTWGVDNSHALQIWKGKPEVTGTRGMETMKSKPLRSRDTGRSTVQELAASRRVAFASTYDLPCDDPCGTCPAAGTRGLWLFPLGAAKATKVAQLTPTERDAAPAIAMADDRGVAAYRAGGALHLLWLVRDGVPIGAPIRFAEGDVGAPAVAIAGGKAVVAWARRGDEKDPYALAWFAADHGTTTLPAARPIATPESAFAPAVITDGTRAALAWTQGDGGTRGAILATRFALDAAAPPAPLAVSSADETNARDPELAGTVDAPVLVYGTFSKARPGGVARLARLTCAGR